MTMPLALTGLPSSDPLPGNYVQVLFAQGQTAGDLSVKRALIIAPSTAAGSIVQDTEIYGPVNDESEMIGKVGAGSQAHRAGRAFMSVNKTTPLYMICPTRSAGTAASLAVTFTGSGGATGDGVSRFFICEEQIDTNYVAGDSVTTHAAAVVANINARTWLPVTASAAAGVITITAKAPGPEGNAILVTPVIVSGSGFTVSPSVETPLASGVTQVSYTAALATLLGQKFSYILSTSFAGAGSDAVLAALMTQVTSQALPTNGKRQKVFAGASLSPSLAATLSSAINNPRFDLYNLRGSPLEPGVIAAVCAAAVALNEAADKAYNFDGYGAGIGDIFPLLKPRTPANNFNPTELRVMLGAGTTPIGITETGVAYIVRRITSYCLNGSNSDFRVRDAHRVTVADGFADDSIIKLSTGGWSKICDDPVGAGTQPSAQFITPKRGAATLEVLMEDYVDAGWFDPARLQDMITALATGLDPQNLTRMNVRSPIYAANLYHQSAHLVAESSAAA